MAVNNLVVQTEYTAEVLAAEPPGNQILVPLSLVRQMGKIMTETTEASLQELFRPVLLRPVLFLLVWYLFPLRLYQH